NKWESFGWHVIQCDGHNIKELLEAFAQAKTIKLKPTAIVAHTVKGKGVSFMEHVVDFHGRPPTQEEKTIAIRELEEIAKDEEDLKNG
ncbi:MAG: transketolase, partial [Candidatus Omnitrophota bacterium]